jgi:hypothetical protein
VSREGLNVRGRNYNTRSAVRLLLSGSPTFSRTHWLTEAFNRILRVRSAELARAIDEVKTGSYSISDKQKMLVPLEQEKDWVDAAILSH